MELLEHMKSQILSNTIFLDELGICPGGSRDEILDKNNHIFTTAVPYGDTDYIYIALKLKSYK